MEGHILTDKVSVCPLDLLVRAHRLCPLDLQVLDQLVDDCDGSFFL